MAARRVLNAEGRVVRREDDASGPATRRGYPMWSSDKELARKERRATSLLRRFEPQTRRLLPDRDGTSLRASGGVAFDTARRLSRRTVYHPFPSLVIIASRGPFSWEKEGFRTRSLRETIARPSTRDPLRDVSSRGHQSRAFGCHSNNSTAGLHALASDRDMRCSDEGGSV